NKDLHLLAHQLLPLLARHLLRPRHFAAFTSGRSRLRRALSHRDGAVVHAHQHALVVVGIDPEGGPAHTRYGVLRLDLELLFSLEHGDLRSLRRRPRREHADEACDARKAHPPAFTVRARDPRYSPSGRARARRTCPASSSPPPARIPRPCPAS